MKDSKFSFREANERFGVVNLESRRRYEKEFQVPYGYDFISFDKNEAIWECKKTKTQGTVVERIYDTALNKNSKEVIYIYEEKND